VKWTSGHWREFMDRRTIEAALRTARAPDPPSGLEARLLAEAGVGRAAKSGAAWAYASLAAVCVAVGALWLNHAVTSRQRESPVLTARSSNALIAAATKTAAHPNGRRAALQTASRNARPKQNSRPRTSRAAPPVVVQASQDPELGAMTVLIGRASPGAEEVAVASSVTDDGRGGLVVRAPRSKRLREKVIYTEPGRGGRRLTVASMPEWAKNDGDQQ